MKTVKNNPDYYFKTKYCKDGKVSEIGKYVFLCFSQSSVLFRLKIEVSLLHDILALTIDFVTCIICNKTTSKKSTMSNEHDANNGDDQATSSVWKTVLINLVNSFFIWLCTVQ